MVFSCFAVYVLANNTRVVPYFESSNPLFLFTPISGLSDVCELTQYRDLKELWVQGNKLRRISFMPTNYRLSHLYLQVGLPGYFLK